MNQKAVLSHLTDAAEQLSAIIANIKINPSYGAEDFTAEMGLLYRHLNTSWNGRNGTDAEHDASGKFSEWRKFPANTEFSL